MWADSFLAHLLHAPHGDVRISRHDVVDAEACKRLEPAIEEDSFLPVPPGNKVRQLCGCGDPERTGANLATLAVKTHRRQGTVCAAVQAEIFDAQFCRFFSPCSRVVQKKQ